MILIVTHSRDLSADFVIRHLLAYGKKYLRLDTDRLGTPECFFGARSIPELHIKGHVVRRNDVTAIWCRRFSRFHSCEATGRAGRAKRVEG